MTKRSSPLDRFARGLSPGTLTWIGLSTQRRGEVTPVEQARTIASQGLQGDLRMRKIPGSARQVTLISEEFIQQIVHFTGTKRIDPASLRRNLVVRPKSSE
jgi:MOSC domain-containing protein YiiM